MAEPKKKKKKKTEIVLTPEEKFQQYVTLMKATRCILRVEDEYKIYLRLVDDFLALAKEAETAPFEGMEQCIDLSSQCAEKAKELEVKLPKQKEEQSQTVTTTAKEREERAKENGSEKKISKTKIALACVAILLVAFVIGYQVNTTRYLIAKVENAVGLQELAMQSYKKLGTFKDSEQKLKEVRFDYEMKQIRQAKKGSVVSFGNEEKLGSGKNKWIVLKKKDGVMTLAKESVEDDLIFHETEEKVTWETSHLREKLNHSFMEEAFDELERQILVETEHETAGNPVYGTEGGKPTKDFVYIPDETEYGECKKALGAKANCIRLRTPGNNQKTTAYISYRGEVVYYGIPVNDAGAAIRPVVRIRYKEK